MHSLDADGEKRDIEIRHNYNIEMGLKETRRVRGMYSSGPSWGVWWAVVNMANSCVPFMPGISSQAE
jgi:hypothetical protein